MNFSMNMLQTHRTGFTLIELLVVIAIVGLLASIVLASVDEARQSARDTVRKSAINNISSMMEIYYTDNGAYPPEAFCDSSIGSAGVTCGTMIANGSLIDSWDSTSKFYQVFQDGGYMILPVDPINNDQFYYQFEPSNDGWQGYYFRARLEENGQFYAACGGTYDATWCR